MMFFNTTSKGWPFFSYIPMRKAGSITTIISMAAGLVPRGFRNRKNSGTPTSAPQPKQMSCLFVRLNSTFERTRLKSFGTVT